MATYFHGNPSEIGGGGADGLQTLILMNPAYVGYADQNNNHQQPPQPQQQSSNFVFLNNSNNNNHAHSVPHAPPSQTQHFVGVPLHGGNTPSSASPHDHLHHGFLHPRAHSYGLYNLPPDLGAARDFTRAQQGLSLSLSSSQPPPPPPPPGYGSFCRTERPDAGMDVSSGRADDVRVSVASPSASGVTNGVNGVQSVLLSSKYLKAAQELLDEVVNVGSGAKAAAASAEPSRGQAKNIAGENSAASGDGQSGGAESSGKRGGAAAELTTAERQEIQMKKAKLVNMLDEVEQRYMQYHHQMQIVISWFEQAAGIGSAKTYTALALQTISKQFRCLKDAILAQIRSASRSLGEDEANLDGKIEGSRLKYVDNQIRQQRALQQLGMIQHNAWRPQRGLPERSVSVLRAWLFEHFLHPYPKDSDKLMLAKQTGLTRSQVSNWFINARVRLWKPMVEEMYTEEMKENDIKNGGAEDKTERNNITNQDSTSKAKSPNNTEHHHHNNNNNPNIMSTNSVPGFNNMSSDIETITTQNNNNNNNNHSPKKLRINDMLHGYDRQDDGKDVGFSLMGGPANFIGGFGSYPMGELGRFGADPFPYSGGGSSSNNNNGVSLTLGLPHCENSLGAHQSFLPGQGMQQIGEAGGFGGHQTNAHQGNVYENISIPDRKRFAAQLLPDFVA